MILSMVAVSLPVAGQIVSFCWDEMTNPSNPFTTLTMLLMLLALSRMISLATM